MFGCQRRQGVSAKQMHVLKRHKAKQLLPVMQLERALHAVR